MMASPAAATALVCRSCRHALFRAVLSSPNPSPRMLPLRSARPVKANTSGYSSLLPHRPFTTTIARRDDSNPSNDPDEVSEDQPSSSKPWFLDVKAPRHPPSQHQAVLPTVPADAPAMLNPMIKYVYEDMGLDDISLLDLRDLDPPPALGPNLIMLVGSARSERHLHIAAGRFARWLRRNYKVNATADGLIGAGELRTKLRRLRKKAKLLGNNTAMIPGGDNGISTGWVCVNFKHNDGQAAEVASFDESGKMSGFGAPQTATTIVIQCLTEPRRDELELEALWRKKLEKSLQQAHRIQQGMVDEEDLNRTLSSKIQHKLSPSAMQWQALEQASNQKRLFSTSARRLQMDQMPGRDQRPDIEAGAEMQDAGPARVLDFSDSQSAIRNIQLGVSPLTSDILEQAIMAALTSPGDAPTSQRLAVVDELLLTAEERGMELWTTSVLVALIESICTSPAYGPKLRQAQANLEYLLSETKSPPTASQITVLMRVYAQRREWDKFWNAFRIPTRYAISHEAEHFELAYRSMAATQDSHMCRDALRWVFPEMIRYGSDILRSASLHESLLACIMVADAYGQYLLVNGGGSQSREDRRRSRRGEFVRMRLHVTSLRREAEKEMQLKGRADTEWKDV